MHIGVNARFLASPFTGIGVYTRHLFSALAAQCPQDKIFMVAPRESDFSFPPNVEKVVLPEKFPGTSGMRKTFWEQVQVPRLFSHLKTDLAHFPYPSNPWRGYDKPVVVTVHDTIPWVLPSYRKSVSTRLYQDRCRNAVKKADHVVTVSESSKKEIIDLCGISPSKISVIPNAPSPSFSKNLYPDERSGTLKKYGINPDRRFFLYCGGYDERKNVSIITETYLSHIAPYHDIDLVLAGGKSHESALYSSYDLTNRKYSHSLGASKGKIIFTGFVSEEHFPALYQSCFVFLNLSRREGFNLPLLEAAVSGAPVVASDIPVHREVAGGYALFCPPDDKPAFAEVLKKLISDQSFYQKQKETSKKYVCPYSWEKSASGLTQIYKKCL